jgi:hypothetical protein
MDEFKKELVKNIKDTVRYLKTIGTEAMSVDNLLQLTPTPKLIVNLAPAGYRELFATVAKETCPNFLVD